MSQVVETEALSFCKYDPGADCRRTQMDLHECRRPDKDLAVLDQRRKNEVVDFRIRALCAPDQGRETISDARSVVAAFLAIQCK